MMTPTVHTARFLRSLLALVLYSGAFIVGICSAQLDGLTLLPPELQSTAAVDEMRNKLCMSCMDVEQPAPPNVREVLPFCQQICRTDNRILNRQCWEHEAAPCDEGQSPVCSYRDAIVCAYDDGSGSCVYHSEGQSFCICRDESGSWSEEPKESCVPFKPPTTPSSEMCPFGSDPRDDGCLPPPLPTTPGPSTAPGRGVSAGQVNLPAVVLGCVLSVVVLLVIIGVGVWCVLRRRGPSDSSRKNRNAEDSSRMNLNENAPRGTAKPSEQMVPDAHEYAYVDANWRQEPTNPETGEPKPECHTGQENHYYFKVDKVTTEGSDRYVKHGPEGRSSEQTGTTEAPSDPEYFVLEKEDLGDEGREDGSVTSVSPEKEDDGDYLQTTAPPFQNENSGYEVAVLSPVANEDESSQYDRLDRASGKRTNEGVLPGKDNGVYDSLETDDDYNHIARDGQTS
ncbi:uncharacterized protein LOC119727025 isoform X2 [Patiria miniata]|uniref:Uncharacterized protein n=1 Tax=Patiria miniata TaxID=46514 RepID=A0A913ZSW0_PATMI|nr:uncharacterized protein LOC119727025 isoform X2 [Patiria miniata]